MNMEKYASEALEKRYSEAEVILQDEDKAERFLQRLEKKLQIIPLGGDILAMAPVLASLVRNYIQKKYTDIPIGSVIAIIAALLYLISPIDIIPDAIPIVGYIDDAAVIAVCLKFVQSDVDEYRAWRKKKGMEIDL